MRRILALEETGRGPAYESADVDDFAYTDGQTVERSIQDLARLADSDAPFFLAVGLYRPHLPFSAPSRYWNLYERSEIPEPEPSQAPAAVPAVALHESLELRTQYVGIPAPGEAIGDELADTLRHGYLASVSYSDALIGRVVAAIDELGIRDETIVVVVGDNGFSLGEHEMWVKHSNFDDALRVPLIMRVPGAPRGARVSSVVELLDIYPTLADLAGLPAPEELDGSSRRSDVEGRLSGTGARAVSQYHSFVSNDPGLWIGESIRTADWLYTEWREDDGSLHARMLFDHGTDEAETLNVAEDVDPAVAEALSAELRAVTGTPAN